MKVEKNIIVFLFGMDWIFLFVFFILCKFFYNDEKFNFYFWRWCRNDYKSVDFWKFF